MSKVVKKRGKYPDAGAEADMREIIDALNDIYKQLDDIIKRLQKLGG